MKTEKLSLCLGFLNTAGDRKCNNQWHCCRVSLMSIKTSPTTSHGTEIGGSRISGYTLIFYCHCVVISFLAITVCTYLSWNVILIFSFVLGLIYIKKNLSDTLWVNYSCVLLTEAAPFLSLKQIFLIYSVKSPHSRWSWKPRAIIGLAQNL